MRQRGNPSENTGHLLCLLWIWKLCFGYMEAWFTTLGKGVRWQSNPGNRTQLLLGGGETPDTVTGQPGPLGNWLLTQEGGSHTGSRKGSNLQLENRRKAKGRRLCSTKGHMGPQKQHELWRWPERLGLYPPIARSRPSYLSPLTSITLEPPLLREGKPQQTSAECYRYLPGVSILTPRETPGNK